MPPHHRPIPAPLFQSLRPVPDPDDAPVELERLLTAREIGSYLGMTTNWVLDRWQAGDLPGYRLGGGRGPVRFRASEIERWLRDHRRGPYAGGATG